MKFITHISKSHDEESHSVWLMEVEGKSHVRAYFFVDEPKKGYIDHLSVDNQSREQGIGAETLTLAENECRARGCTEIFLWTWDDSWMYQWYIRRGYVTNAAHDREKNCTWLRKQL